MNKQPTRNNEAIIRQSQLERAIDLFKLFEKKPSLREVLRLSQILTDFQYNWNLNSYEILKFEKHFGLDTKPELISSVPHVENTTDKKIEKVDVVSQYQTQIAKQLKGK